jgi:hypothetical protein
MFTYSDITDTLLAHADEGYSVNAQGEVPTTGYMVGGFVPSLVLSGDELRPYATTDAWLTKNWSYFTINLRAYYAGVWTDSDTGKIYIDISRNVDTLSEAIAVGLNLNEIAIWDVVNGREIRLQD